MTSISLGLLQGNAGPGAEPAGAGDIGTWAEKAGFESLWAIEHVVVPKGFQSPYPYNRTGRLPRAEASPYPDPIVWMSWVAARTNTILIGTCVLILPLRNPVVLAKQCATLDSLANGRLRLGVGVGWLREEFEAVGAEFGVRGRRAEEYIHAMRALWSDDETYHGETVTFDQAHCYPKPARGRVPIHIGGNSDIAARRAGRMGDGFMPARYDRAVEYADIVRSAARDAGRDPKEIELHSVLPPRAAQLSDLLAAGYTHFLVPISSVSETGDLTEADFERTRGKAADLLREASR